MASPYDAPQKESVSRKAQLHILGGMGKDKEGRTEAGPFFGRGQHPNSRANLAPPYGKATPTPMHIPNRLEPRDPDKPELSPKTGEERK